MHFSAKIISSLVAFMLFGFLGIANACDDSTQLAISLKLDSKVQAQVDSLHKIVKSFRQEQGKKIEELRVKIEEELVKPNANMKILGTYAKQQADYRLAIQKKWLDCLMQVKKLVTPEQFPSFIASNWGCKCGDADCGCVPSKK